MSRFKKIVALMAMTATLCASAKAFSAQNDCGQCGYAYEGTQCASSISPWLAVGAVAAVTTAVIIVYNNNHHHSKHSGSGSGGTDTGGGTSHSHSH